MASFQYLRNQFLFSEAYLFSLLETEGTDESLDGIRQSLKDWLDVADFANLDTALASFIEPVLQTLQFACQPPPQSEPKTQSGNSQSFVQLLYTDFTFQNPVGVCFAAAPLQDLSCTLKGSNFAENIIRLLRENDLKWGILTNGKLWRLYHESEPMPYETYFEVDLPALLQKPESKEFSLFARFFGVRAFYSSDEREREQRLDEMKRASEQATEEIGKHLREKIETILENICAGFVADEGKERFTEAQREEIHHNAIYLLYRIMFLLYAEARNLLPMENPKYREKSLERLIEISYKNQTEGIENPDGYELWKSLRQLCTEIDLGNAELEVAPYDGGLFDAGTHPYLSEHQMTNAYLSPVLYALAYYEKKKSPLNFRGRSTRINYRDMSVRHLGTLYEGILEYKLFVAEEPMVVRPTKSGFQFLPEREAGTLKKTDRRIPIGGVYFAQNPGERKATGSYYTPEYIVEYIVQNTVGEKLKELKATLKQSLSKDLDALKVAISDDERVRFQRFIDRQTHDFVNERVLSFRVLDPAMGSGHFLVNATNATANFITELLNETDWENPELDTSTAEWRRRVVESCIFGVDLNPLAVELSKLSLWITAAAKDRPLSFLDHHLKWGNSLIGAKLNELGRYPQVKKGKGESQTPEAQMSLFTENRDFQRDIAEAIRGYLAIEKIVTRQREDVETKKEKLETIERILRPYRELCELHTGGYFENEFSEYDYSRLITDFQPDAWDTLREKYDVAQTLARTADRRFFHWELEFPEVFFEEGGWKENPGFDAVIGNPPYGSKGMLDESEKDYLQADDRYPSSSDISAIFINDSCLYLTSTDGMVGLLIPKALSYVQSWSDSRTLCLRYNILAFGDVSQGFENVLLEMMILLLRKQHLTNNFVRIASISEKQLKDVGMISPSQLKTEIFPLYYFGNNQKVIDRIQSVSIPLGNPNLAEIFSGPGIQKYIGLPNSDVLTLRGNNIARYETRGCVYLPSDKIVTDISNYIAPKIVLQIIVAHVTKPSPRIILMGNIDSDGAFVVNTVTCVRGISIHNGFILACFNSKLLSWYQYNYAFCRAVRNMHLYPSYISQLPIRRIRFTTPPGKCKQLCETAKGLYLDLDNRLLDFADERLKAEPEQSDVVHDLLAYLAEQMIEMNKQKQDTVKDFLTWLEGEISCPIDELSGKTIIQGFYEQSVDKLLETFGKNAKKLSVDAKSPVFQEEFTQRYESQMATLRPLMERIQRTDELIDQIVYKLYGLTEGEIKIVEGCQRISEAD